jgi:hypothetical protein
MMSENVYDGFKPSKDFDPVTMTKCTLCDKPAVDTNCFGLPVCVEHMSGGKKEWLLRELREQLAIATDLGEKRWRALNEIYEQADKRSANWCKRKAAEGLSIEVK